MGESMDEFDDDPNYGKQEEKDDDQFKSNLRYAPTLKEGGRSKDRQTSEEKTYNAPQQIDRTHHL